jgi:hypothetical protein
MEIPFPEADAPAQQSPQPLDTNPSPAAARQPAVPSSAVKPVKPPKPAGAPIWKTAIWKQRIDPIIFISIAAVLLTLLVAVMLMMRAKQVAVPVVNKVAEAKVAKERTLREEGNRLLRAGRVNDANSRYEQLLKLAPRSPAILALMQKLSQVRQQDEAGRQQLTLAQQKFDEGLALYNQKKFAESIPLFEQSFHLNPSSDEATKYLKLAQQEDERVKYERNAARASRTTPQPRQTQTAGQFTSVPTRQVTTTHTVQPAPQTPSGPASITTVFNSTITDGYIVVRAGADEVARENLFTESRFFHKRSPRQVNVTKEFPAKNADLDFWVAIPSLSVNEHRRLSAQNFEPGVNRRLVVTFDPKTKKVDYQFN